MYPSFFAKSHLPPARRNGEGGDHGDFLPGSGALVEDRGLADRRPGAPHRGDQHEAGFVDEDDVGTQPRSVFFNPRPVAAFRPSTPWLPD
jgi:hypothetical protein